MNSRFRSILAMVLMLIASSLFASDGKKRAVQKPPAAPVSPPPPAAPPVLDATLIGTVVDSQTGMPVIGANVRSPSSVTLTDEQGIFTVRGRSGVTVDLTISRFGYESSTVTITTRAGTTSQRFPLVARPTVRVRTTTGQSYQLATETVEFGYVVPFSGFTKDRAANMCKPDGSPFMPDRDEIRRIEGPAKTATHAACCPNAPITSVTLEMKSGEKTEAFFVDSCYGYTMEVVGLDNVTAKLVDLKLVSVAEVLFP